MIATMLSLGVIAALVLIGAGLWGLRLKGAPRLKPALMIAAGAVTLINIYFFATMPAVPQ